MTKFVLDSGVLVRGLAHLCGLIDDYTECAEVIENILTRCDRIVISQKILKECYTKRIIAGFYGTTFIDIFNSIEAEKRKEYNKKWLIFIGKSLIKKVENDADFNKSFNSVKDKDTKDKKLFTCAIATNSDTIISRDSKWISNSPLTLKLKKNKIRIHIVSEKDFLKVYSS